MKRFLIALILATAAATALGGEPFVVKDATRDAFSKPFAGLSDADRERFFRGRSLFHQSWVIAPAKDDQVDGLGPLYNRLACISCHARNGRGSPPEGPDQRMTSMLVRLSVPGADEHGGPKPHPAYGGQFNEEGIPGVPGEGRVALHWEEETVRLASGEAVKLRHPRIEFLELAYGPIDGVLTSPRLGQQVIGLGLLDAVSDRALERMAAEAKPDGVKGRVNRVWDPVRQRVVAGRFGYKANMPSLRAQIAGASQGDLGITSTLFPTENCTPVQTACAKAPNGGSPELSDTQLDEMEYYLAHLAVPARRGADKAGVRKGEARFSALGCAACHRTQLRTGADTRFPALAKRTIRPYTDLLLHDMGAGLSDGRPDYLAGGSEWRTPPLWGIGLADTVGEDVAYLHDGRARNLLEAILWHGGEAKRSRERFAKLTPAQREEVIAFLRSL